MEKSNNEIDILIGGGVDASIIKELYDKTGATSYHMSGKVVVDSEMEYRKEDVNMGVAAMSEYDIWRTSSMRVAEARRALNEIRDEK